MAWRNASTAGVRAISVFPVPRTRSTGSGKGLGVPGSFRVTRSARRGVFKYSANAASWPGCGSDMRWTMPNSSALSSRPSRASAAGITPVLMVLAG
ncbi:MAG: hypothetical protein FJZ89_01265 [Chloroflexi bacterium]|nr:hypothetical protein [Chloroflexota bacterium]